MHIVAAQEEVLDQGAVVEGRAGVREREVGGGFEVAAAMKGSHSEGVNLKG